MFVNVRAVFSSTTFARHRGMTESYEKRKQRFFNKSPSERRKELNYVMKLRNAKTGRKSEHASKRMSKTKTKSKFDAPIFEQVHGMEEKLSPDIARLAKEIESKNKASDHESQQGIERMQSEFNVQHTNESKDVKMRRKKMVDEMLRNWGMMTCKDISAHLAKNHDKMPREAKLKFIHDNMKEAEGLRLMIEKSMLSPKELKVFSEIGGAFLNSSAGAINMVIASLFTPQLVEQDDECKALRDEVERLVNEDKSVSEPEKKGFFGRAKEALTFVTTQTGIGSAMSSIWDQVKKFGYSIAQLLHSVAQYIIIAIKFGFNFMFWIMSNPFLMFLVISALKVLRKNLCQFFGDLILARGVKGEIDVAAQQKRASATSSNKLSMVGGGGGGGGGDGDGDVDGDIYGDGDGVGDDDYAAGSKKRKRRLKDVVGDAVLGAEAAVYDGAKYAYNAAGNAVHDGAGYAYKSVAVGSAEFMRRIIGWLCPEYGKRLENKTFTEIWAIIWRKSREKIWALLIDYGCECIQNVFSNIVVMMKPVIDIGISLLAMAPGSFLIGVNNAAEAFKRGITMLNEFAFDVGKQIVQDAFKLQGTFLSTQYSIFQDFLDIMNPFKCIAIAQAERAKAMGPSSVNELNKLQNLDNNVQKLEYQGKKEMCRSIEERANKSLTEEEKEEVAKKLFAEVQEKRQEAINEFTHDRELYAKTGFGSLPNLRLRIEYMETNKQKYEDHMHKYPNVQDDMRRDLINEVAEINKTLPVLKEAFASAERRLNEKFPLPEITEDGYNGSWDFKYADLIQRTKMAGKYNDIVNVARNGWGPFEEFMDLGCSKEELREIKPGPKIEAPTLPIRQTGGGSASKTASASSSYRMKSHSSRGSKSRDADMIRSMNRVYGIDNEVGASGNSRTQRKRRRRIRTLLELMKEYEKERGSREGNSETVRRFLRKKYSKTKDPPPGLPTAEAAPPPEAAIAAVAAAAALAPEQPPDAKTALLEQVRTRFGDAAMTSVKKMLDDYGMEGAEFMVSVIDKYGDSFAEPVHIAVKVLGLKFANRFLDDYGREGAELLASNAERGPAHLDMLKTYITNYQRLGLEIFKESEKYGADAFTLLARCKDRGVEYQENLKRVWHEYGENGVQLMIDVDKYGKDGYELLKRNITKGKDFLIAMKEMLGSYGSVGLTMLKEVDRQGKECYEWLLKFIERGKDQVLVLKEILHKYKDKTVELLDEMDKHGEPGMLLLTHGATHGDEEYLATMHLVAETQGVDGVILMREVAEKYGAEGYRLLQASAKGGKYYLDIMQKMSAVMGAAGLKAMDEMMKHYGLQGVDALKLSLEDGKEGVALLKSVVQKMGVRGIELLKEIKENYGPRGYEMLKVSAEKGKEGLVVLGTLLHENGKKGLDMMNEFLKLYGKPAFELVGNNLKSFGSKSVTVLYDVMEKYGKPGVRRMGVVMGEMGQNGLDYIKRKLADPKSGNVTPAERIPQGIAGRTRSRTRAAAAVAAAAATGTVQIGGRSRSGRAKTKKTGGRRYFRHIPF